MTIDFHGAKIALLIGDERLLAYQRDDKVGIPFPGRWDLPGGGREGAETPVEARCGRSTKSSACRWRPRSCIGCVRTPASISRAP